MSEPLSTAQQARLTKLQDAYEQAPPSFNSGLTASDLLLLLRHDATLRSLIGELVFTPPLPPQQQLPPPQQQRGLVAEAQVPSAAAPVRAPTHADPLRKELAAPLALLAMLQRYPEVLSAWGISLAGSEGLRMTTLVACAANWDRIEMLWDVLAQRCKQERRPCCADESAMLAACLGLYNLILTGRQAELQEVVPGSAYDYRTQERGGGAGETVATLWLPGLKNGGGILRKKPLIETQ